jgi:hypothetical protein
MDVKNCDSEECTKSELDLFSVPSIQTVVEEGQWDSVDPHSNYRQASTLRFDIPCTSNEYLDLSQTELHLHLKLYKEKNQLASEVKKISVVNNLLHSLFKQIQVSFNNQPIENTNDTYPYRAYLENLLCNNKESKETTLRGELWTNDTNLEYAGEKDISTDKVNPGYVSRISKFVNKEVHLAGRLHLDVFTLNKYMLNNVAITLQLTRSDAKFYFISTESLTDAEKYKIEIENASLRIRRVTISPSTMLAHALQLRTMSAKYPIKRVVINPIVIPFNTTKFTIANIHVGSMPSRVLVGFVHTDQYDGDFTTNPFLFQHLNLKEISLKAASRNIPYSAPLEFDFAKDSYLEGYMGLFKNINETPNGLTYEDYKNGNTLYAFDLTPDMCSAEHTNITRDGSLQLSVVFAKILERSITAIFYLEFDNIIEIDVNRKVAFDYKV